MKNALLFFIFIFGINSLAQTHSNNSDPTKNMPISNKGQTTLPTIQNLTSTLRHDTCLDKQFSVVFNIVLDSNGVMTPTTIPNDLNTMMVNMNAIFKRICVSFTSCSTVLIPQYEYRKWKKNIADTIITASWYTDKTINVYVVFDVVIPDPTNLEAEGYTYPPPPANYVGPTKDVIVIESNQLTLNNSATMLHLLGHYFGLPHTHGEINPQSPATPPPPGLVESHEFANGSNCYTHGDGFCDTEADPGTYAVTADGNGQYYVLPLDNLMSYYGSFRCRFTQEQYNYMAYMILTRRLYLH